METLNALSSYISAKAGKMLTVTAIKNEFSGSVLYFPVYLISQLFKASGGYLRLKLRW
jgi:hypothetical protein